MPGGIAGGILWFFGQMFFVPLQTFVFGMERMLETMQGVQGASQHAMELVAGGPATVQPANPPALSPVPQSPDWNQSAAAGHAHNTSEEIKRMNKDLNDDMLKLVRYKILFVKRDYEHAFPEREELVSDNIDGSAFTAWKIAEFIQRLNKKPVEVPSKFRDYSSNYIIGDETAGYQLTGLEEEDKKYLRVYYEVLERYHREKLEYEERHLAELRQIGKYVEKIANK